MFAAGIPARPAQRNLSKPVRATYLLFVSLGVAALVAMGVSVQRADAQAQAAITTKITVNGLQLDDGVVKNVVMDPASPPRIEISVSNGGQVPITVSSSVIQGRVVGVPLFRCEAKINKPVLPGETLDEKYVLDSSCLQDQATGLIPSRLYVTNENRQPLGTVYEINADIKGSLQSIYGYFGGILIALTVLTLLGALVALARHKLPANRWSRAMRFAIPGVALGFAIIWVLSVAGISPPGVELLIPVVGGCFIVLGLLGYLSPGPDEPEYATPEMVAGSAATLQMSQSAVGTAPLPAVGVDPSATAGAVPVESIASPTSQMPAQPPEGGYPPTPTEPPPSQTVKRIEPDQEGT